MALNQNTLVFGGRSLIQHLTRLFNAILLSGHIPPLFQQGHVIPIPKSHTKDLSNPSNYRGITILSNISKVLEKLILLRIHLQDLPPSLNPLQGGFRQGYGCAHTAFVLQEAIQSLREKSKKAYVAFLDVRKAFDTVWQAGLLVKLHQKGIKGHLWRLINNWYRTASSTVLWAQQASRPFNIRQGVRQGGVLSPFLYCLFVDQLLDILTASGFGVSIDNIYCGAPMYADDLALVAGSPEELQAMLDIVHNYAQKWKSVVMVFGETTRTRRLARSARKWTLGDEVLKEVDEQHHLGILRTVFNSTIHRTNERATAGRSTFYALNTVGSRFGRLHPLTSLKFYQALCLPLLLYGSEPWTLTKTELLSLEQVHRRILRTIQGLPIRCRSASLTTLLGVQDIQTLVQQRQLNFIVSVANLDSNALPRKILSTRSASTTAKGITHQYHQVLNNLNLPDLSYLLSEPPKCSPWKAFIKKHMGLISYLTFLEECDDCHVSQCAFKPLHPAPHWKVTIGDPKLTRLNNFRIRLLVGCDGLEADAACFRSRTTNAQPGDPSCKLCNQGVPEDAAHFVSTCPALGEERVRLYTEAPPTVRSQIHKFTRKISWR